MTSTPSGEPEFEVDFSHFVFAQEDVFETALSELRRGRKQTHWMWFIFPQLDGLGRSAMARRYAIRSLEEAAAYLSQPILGARLLDCCRALLAVKGRTASQIFGDPDDIKLRSSMTLFSQVSDAPDEFMRVLEQYFGGGHDQLTLDRLERSTKR